MSEKQSLIVEAGESRTSAPLSIFGNEMWIKLSGRDTEGAYAVIEDRTPAHGGPPLHRHQREDEFFYVLEGEYVFEVDGKQIQAGAGSSIFAPKGTVHRFRNTGQTAGRLLVVVQPAGLDEFFIDIDRAANGAREPDLASVVPIFERHGLELLGPPLPQRNLDSKSEIEVAVAH